MSIVYKSKKKKIPPKISQKTQNARSVKIGNAVGGIGTVVSVHITKAYGGVETQRHSFLTLELDRNEYSASCLGALRLGKEPPAPIE
jgi:hypothetical protein